MTNKQIEARLNLLESMISMERDTKQLAFLNQLYQKLLDKWQPEKEPKK